MGEDPSTDELQPLTWLHLVHLLAEHAFGDRWSRTQLEVIAAGASAHTG